MRLRSRLLAPLLTLTLIPQTSELAAAAPADVTRPADQLLEVCPEPISCHLRAIGDFNGDGLDDLVVAPAEEQVFGGRRAPIAARVFWIYFAPFPEAFSHGEPSEPRAADVTIALRRSSSRNAVFAQDVDRDGLTDLILTGSLVHGPILESVFLLRGRVVWPPEISVDTGGADLTIERRRDVVAPLEAARTATELQARFGDLDGNGLLDLVLGSDLPIDVESLIDVAEPTIQSQVSVFRDLPWHPGPNQPWPATLHLEPDETIDGLGSCLGSLAGLADVSGDGMDDILYRRCPGDGLPDLLEVRSSGGETSPDGSGHIRPVLPVQPRLTLPGFGRLDSGEEVPAPPPGNRGYLALLGSRGPLEGPNRPFFLEDVSGDGLADIVMAAGANTHVWLGGPDVAQRVAALRSDRIYVGAGFGMTPLSRSWRPADFNDDGRLDLMLTERREGATLPTAEPEAPDDPLEPAPVRAPEADPRVNLDLILEPGAKLYLEDWQQRRVLDTRRLTPQARWNGRQTEGDSRHVWGMGDFDGDGVTDLLLSGGMLNQIHSFEIVLGPF